MTPGAWAETATAHLLPDGRRLHLQHGPIDLIVEADGQEADISSAYDQARAAFDSLLPALVGELPRLRAANGPAPAGPVARRMVAATALFASHEFITPMAAVAGSVADFVLSRLTEGRTLNKAYVNNGGDIAFTVAAGELRTGICDDPATGTAGGVIRLRAVDVFGTGHTRPGGKGPVTGAGGLATSGWRGRSHSLGIADAVTVLAGSAAEADAAATLIANAVDLPGSPKITRQPADTLSPDSDLGARPVTTGVAPLEGSEIEEALARGLDKARAFISAGLIRTAYLALDGVRKVAEPEQSLTQHDVREATRA